MKVTDIAFKIWLAFVVVVFLFIAYFVMKAGFIWLITGNLDEDIIAPYEYGFFNRLFFVMWGLFTVFILIPDEKNNDIKKEND